MATTGPRCRTTLTPTCLFLALLGVAGLPRAGASPPPVQTPGARGTYYAQWAEVLTVTDTWLVLRNRDGEQYPVSFDAIGLFIVRWPTTVDRISPGALVEATGLNVQSNRVLTSQVDVYEGAARDLVAPGLLTTTNVGYPVTPMDFLINADAYGAPFPGLDNPIQGGQQAPAGRVHLVGPLVNRVPMVVAFPLQSSFIASNNTFTIVPTNAGLNLTQVTLGSPSMVRQGDLVYFVASEARPRSLILLQLVVYKPMPVDQYTPRTR